MSWEPVTWWALRCDGETTAGRCEQRYSYLDEDHDLQVGLWPTRALTDAGHSDLRVQEWLSGPDGLVLCPDHVAAREQMVRAMLDGLPFDDVEPDADRAGMGSRGDQRGEPMANHAQAAVEQAHRAVSAAPTPPTREAGEQADREQLARFDAQSPAVVDDDPAAGAW